MRRIAKRVEGALSLARVQAGVLRGEGTVNKLFVRERGTQIKIEVTPVLRGCVFEPAERAVSDAVERQFGFAAMQVVSLPDLFAGKLMAALDRQHPRDLFDVHNLLSNEGIDDGLRAAFIVYLISHHRPIERLLAPVRHDMTEEFERGLAGMMEVPVALDVLVRTREELVTDIVGHMPNGHRDFLRSFAKGQPDWSLLEVRNVSTLPAVRWRMRKLAQLGEEEREALVTRVERALAESTVGDSAPRSVGRRGVRRMHTPELQNRVDSPTEGNYQIDLTMRRRGGTVGEWNQIGQGKYGRGSEKRLPHSGCDGLWWQSYYSASAAL